MEFKYGNLFFSSNFDSGNLLNVERVIGSDENCANQTTDSNKPDYDFNVWTKPDCYGTEFENGNRTWFYFSVKGYAPNRIIKLTIKNLNRQQRLYSQGYCPLYKTEIPNIDNSKWLRIRFRPTWETNENNFQLTFLHKFSEYKNSVTYFAFCYPWSYRDCQKQLEDLDNRFKELHTYNWDSLSTMNTDTIYYHRELLTYSLDGRRIDLLTITNLEGLKDEHEEKFDENLFPITSSRPWVFENKKVFVVTCRVHPGETPSSHVFNGFLEFILKPNDVRSNQLRKRFIFKLIPLLNPDGVYHGHYRTDTKGINLNRVYLYPDFKSHPSIYAAKSILVYYHIVNSSESVETIETIKSNVFGNLKSLKNGVTISNNAPLEQVTNSKEIEVSACEDVNETGVKLKTPSLLFAKNDDKNISPTSELSSNCKVVLETVVTDYFEVDVDLDNQNSDIDFNDLCNKNFSNEIKTEVKESPCTYATKNLENHEVNTLSSSENNMKSIYKFSKVSSKDSVVFSKSMESTDKTKFGEQLNSRNSQIFSQTNNIHQPVKPIKKISSSMIPLPLKPAIVSMKFSSKKISKTTINPTQLYKMKQELRLRNGYKPEPKIGNEGSDDDTDKECITENSLVKCSLHLSDSSLLSITPDRSGIAFYIDLHGHCSKRGCFMYGNCLDSEDEMISNLLYPKLISLNSAHFDFSGCNFSFKNMYTRDKRDGSSKEGAGRVAIWKHLGIIHSYTLECNYNTGRIVNQISQVTRDDGRLSPPNLESSTLLTPKYTPYHFEDVGKAMAVSALDIYSINPLSRLMDSEYNNLQSLCDYIKKYFNNQKNGIRSTYTYNKKISKPNKTQPSISSISSTSKPCPNNSDIRRASYSHNSVSLCSSRKSQSFQMRRLSNQRFTINSKLPTKPVFANEVILNSQQLDMLQKDGKMEFNKPNIPPLTCQSSENDNNSSCNLNVNGTKGEPCIRFEESKSITTNPRKQIEKISCNSSNILARNPTCDTCLNNVSFNKPKEITSFSTYFNGNMTKSCNNNDSRTLLPLRRNSIANCYIQNVKNEDFLEKEKANQLNDLLSEDQYYSSSPSYCKAFSSSNDNKFNGVRKAEIKTKKLGKSISYSANDIHY